MTIRFISTLLISAAVLTAARCALAADERAVLAFQVPHADTGVESDHPACGDALDLARILADPSLYRALLGSEPDAKLEFDSTDAVLLQLEKYGHTTKGLVAHRVGNDVAQCQSGCAVLPRGARIREILMSDRHAGNGVSITPAPRRPDASKGSESPGSGSASDTVKMGDHGYQGLQITRGDRAVCVTARNWSATEPSTQIVRIFFDR